MAPILQSDMMKRLFHVWFWLTRSMTMGVRVAAFDTKGQIFLVRHTYVKGWHLPGGGIERGETAIRAVHKELQEEGNLEIEDTPQLISVYFNRIITNRDHVLLYTCKVQQTTPKIADREIAEAGFFSVDDLPEETTLATQRRLKELNGGIEISEYWS